MSQFGAMREDAPGALPAMQRGRELPGIHGSAKGGEPASGTAEALYGDAAEIGV